MLFDTVHECFSVILLLLRSGDVETNPGPNTRSESLLDIESLPSDPSEQMNVLFKLLKDLHTRSLQNSKTQAELAADVKSIKNGQKNIETKITGLQNRLDLLEEKFKTVDQVTKAISEVNDKVNSTTCRLEALDLHLVDIEDRSRRDNLIFRGIPDTKESCKKPRPS